MAKTITASRPVYTTTPVVYSSQPLTDRYGRRVVSGPMPTYVVIIIFAFLALAFYAIVFGKPVEYETVQLTPKQQKVHAFAHVMGDMFGGQRRYRY